MAREPAEIMPTGPRPASSMPSQDGRRSIVDSLIAADGSHNHRLFARLITPTVAVRDLADTIHAICVLHGRQPGILDHALERSSGSPAQGWLEVAIEGFAVERAFLAKLASAAGPLPSTPGQAASEAAIAGQRHALDMLAQSDRTGCAIGAAIALVTDWSVMRCVLDAAAVRFGLAVPTFALPSSAVTAAVVDDVAGNPAVERAMAFGVQQVLAQHRGLWDLLEARASARDRQ